MRRPRRLRFQCLETRRVLSGDPRIGAGFSPPLDPVAESDQDSIAEEHQAPGLVRYDLSAEAAYGRMAATSDSESGMSHTYSDTVNGSAAASVFGAVLGSAEVNIAVQTSLMAQSVAAEVGGVPVQASAERNIASLRVEAQGQGLVFLIISGSLEVVEVETASTQQSSGVGVTQAEAAVTDAAIIDFEVRFLAFGEYEFALRAEALHTTLDAAELTESSSAAVRSENRLTHFAIEVSASSFYILRSTFTQRAENVFQAGNAATDTVFAAAAGTADLSGRGDGSLHSGGYLRDTLGTLGGNPVRQDVAHMAVYIVADDNAVSAGAAALSADAARETSPKEEDAVLTDLVATEWVPFTYTGGSIFSRWFGGNYRRAIVFVDDVWDALSS